jgi:DNA-binding transcriptional ArsR family regulator
MGVATPARSTPPRAKTKDQQIAALEERCEKAEAEAKFWEEVAEAESHPLRMMILRVLRDDFPQASPNSLHKLLKQPLSNVSYHAKVLRDRGLIRVVDEIQRRGAVEHILAVTKKARRR